MANSKCDTPSADNTLSYRMPSNMSASNGNCPRPRQPVAPSAPLIQSSHPTWAANRSSGRAYHQLPTPNADFAQSASSPSHLQGARRPNANRPKYAHPDPISFWNCCYCFYANHPNNCPEMCANCEHKKCYSCTLTDQRHMPSIGWRQGFGLDASLIWHHSPSEALTKMEVVSIWGWLFRIGSLSPSHHRVYRWRFGLGSPSWGEKDVG